MTMEQSQFALSWNEHVQNICNGLSLLQRNGEFVDMTLAADGHHVKVHQVIMALCSPYLKDLISSAQCPHPVIYLSLSLLGVLGVMLHRVYHCLESMLSQPRPSDVNALGSLRLQWLMIHGTYTVYNKISHKTLSALLEYIYTGEVLVAVEDLNELIDAAKELHIKGLQDMNVSQSVGSERQKSTELLTTRRESLNGEEDNIHYFEITNEHDDQDKIKNLQRNSCGLIVSNVKTIHKNIDDLYEIDVKDDIDDDTKEMATDFKVGEIPQNQDNTNIGTLQYTVSNQGSLQMILNRFIYYLKHTNRDKSQQWRCVEYLCNAKCPAYVFTKDDVVIQRISAHNHPFHDKKILKKVKDGAVFSAIQEAETEGNIMKSKIEQI